MLTVDPAQRPTLEQVLGHPWLNQGAEASPGPGEAPPLLPDSAIVTTMFDLGYDPYDIWVSLSTKRYDNAMATYLLLKRQRSQGAGCQCQVKPVRRRGLRPRPGPGPPRTLLPKRCSSEPALPSPREQQQPDEARRTWQEGGGSASVPAIPLRFFHVDPPPPSLASQPDPVPSSPDPSLSLRSGVAEEGSSSSPGTSPEQSQDRIGRWKRMVSPQERMNGNVESSWPQHFNSTLNTIQAGYRPGLRQSHPSELHEDPLKPVPDQSPTHPPSRFRVLELCKLKEGTVYSTITTKLQEWEGRKSWLAQ
ncbi:Sperm motility kinase 3 [Sciurus carolinensis]|uniref:Sperm motility kinase 3 n=1 Tax=Sciurus carolinensis TaxID=30640 RepID=A0AA41MQ16_SCICA|nr:Sperm motility kinase 3 [Sciurus carolinensis]